MSTKNKQMIPIPLIGITSGTYEDPTRPTDEPTFRLNASYMEAVYAAGGLPVALPYARPETVQEAITQLDGLILSGGEDIPAEALGVPVHPACKYLRRERWTSECLWYAAARKSGLPILGICLGMQTICVLAGGKLITDIPTELPHAIPHRGTAPDIPHTVSLQAHSWIDSIPHPETVSVLSNHHQAVTTLPESLRVTAFAPDQVIEAVEQVDGSLTVGVQWHPERNPEQPDWLLQGFIAHCRRSA